MAIKKRKGMNPLGKVALVISSVILAGSSSYNFVVHDEPATPSGIGKSVAMGTVDTVAAWGGFFVMGGWGAVLGPLVAQGSMDEAVAPTPPAISQKAPPNTLHK